MKKLITSVQVVLLLLFMSYATMAQTTVSGKVTDADGGEPLVGVNIVIEGTVKGTVTKIDGTYSVKVSEVPAKLVFSMIGFTTQKMDVTATTTTLDVVMEELVMLGEEVVISANRTEESILESPVTVEKMDILNIQQTASPSFYDGLENLKGVNAVKGSLTFTSINTRGFAAVANTRFVQLMDGMDNASPLLNFPTGNIVGISELDMESMELVPGAASALYGPNAFNGILFMNSKNPFEYQGLSATVKVGATDSEEGGTAPYSNFGVRYAKAINDKFAFKATVDILDAEDWRATRYDEGRNVTGTSSGALGSETFDGLNQYGDENLVNLPFFSSTTGIGSIAALNAGVSGALSNNPNFLAAFGNDTVATQMAISSFMDTLGMVSLRRRGINEQDLLNNNDARSIKLSAALHYKINDNLEASYSFRRGSGSTIYQGGERYALRGFSQTFNKLELKGSNFFVRGYMSQTDAGDSYNLSAVGALANESFSATSTSFIPTYLGTLVGTQFGTALAGGDPATTLVANTALARAAAEASTPAVGSAEFNNAVETVRNTLFQRGGAKLVDESKLYHAEFNYQFDQIEVVDIQVGGNWRQYDLFSNGTVFNEDPDGDGNFDRIKINEYGFYTQISKKLMDDRLKLAASIRYDKNENFDGQVNPRASIVYSAGESKNHNFRTSFQTGFRNPDSQAQFIFFPLGTTTLIGGTPANAERYKLYGFPLDATDGGVLSAATRQPIALEYVKPERLSSFEVGYKGRVAKGKVLLDLNYYYSGYQDFIVQRNVISKVATTQGSTVLPAGSPFRTYTNAENDLSSQGIGLGVAYQLPKGYRIDGSYNWATFDEGDADPGFEAGFNTPENRFKVSLSNREVVKNLGFNLAYRWQEGFFWQNSFAIGDIDSYSTLDAQINYKIESIKTMVKLGATNLFGDEYVTNVGGPNIGSLYYISLTFDEFMR